MEPRRVPRGLSQHAGLVAIAVALALAPPLSAAIAIGGVKDSKQARETLVVTGSARYPIAANLATLRLVASAQMKTPAAAIGALRSKVAQIDAFLAQGAIPAAAISKPPIEVTEVSVNSTQLTKAKFAALRLAVADARERASTIAAGLGAHLGQVQKTALGVYQITPRNSTEVSDYGIDDVTSRLKDVESVVTVTFRISH